MVCCWCYYSVDSWLCIVSNGMLDFGCVSCQMVCCWGYYWETIGYVSCQMVCWTLVVYPVKSCVAVVIIGETVVCVSCQIVCWTLVVYPIKCCVAGVISGRQFRTSAKLKLCRT